MSVVVEQRFSLHQGDCRIVLPRLADCSIDSIVTDPPYELGFMGKGWDKSGIAYDVTVWRECLRIVKPGGHLLAFGGSRTYHRLACAIEDAGFEIRDQIQWIYGSGFPKSLDVSKAIDAVAGAVREVVGQYVMPSDSNAGNAGKVIRSVTAESMFGSPAGRNGTDITAPASDAAKQWDGWGTALKPAHEPIVLARRPIVGTVAQNVLQHGTGGLNIDGCRIDSPVLESERRTSDSGDSRFFGIKGDGGERHNALGRWPANVIHDGSEEVLAGFPVSDANGYRSNPSFADSSDSITGWNHGWRGERGHNDSGSAARFFYCAKASREDRNEGCEGLPQRWSVDDDWVSESRKNAKSGGQTSPQTNHHPTVKPTDLMRYLARLVTPPNGIVLDPFTGSGSTGKAAMLEGLRFIGIELSLEFCELAQRRIEAATKQGLLFATA